MNTICECPLCGIHTKANPVIWDLVVNERHSTFVLGCCRMDAELCDIFPSLKRALFHSQIAREMLARLLT